VTLFPQVVYLIAFGKWLLVLMNFMPVSLLVTLEVVKFMQATFVTWDITMFSQSKGVAPKVHDYSLAEELGQVSYILTDKTGTLTQNNMTFRKMSIGGVSYGQSNMQCEDAFKKGVTNFNMVDLDLNKQIDGAKGSNNTYENIQRFLYHLALCHTGMTDCKGSKEDDSTPANNQVSSPSPDELALINAAKYYGIKFVERNQYNEIIIENDHHQQN